MLADIVLFPLYTLTLLCIGFGFFRPVARISKIAAPARELPLDLATVLLMGQFCVGFVALVANFFIGVAHPVVFAAICVFFVLGMPRVARCDRQSLLLLLGFSAVLAPLAAFMPAGYDAGLYHLPHQLWIREEKIVFGLANFHGRFGFGSFQEYINAPQWLGEHFKLLAYSKAAYAVVFMLFLWAWSSSLRRDHVLLAFFTAVTALLFFVMGVKNALFHWDYGFTDSQAGFLFTMAFLSGFSLLRTASKQGRAVDVDVFVFSFLCVFAVLLKLSSILVLAWAAGIFLYLVLSRTMALRRLIMLSVFPMAGLALFSVKNLIASGCFLYPAAASCLEVTWSARANARYDADWITAWARHPDSGLYSLESSAWLKNFWLPEYGPFCLRVVLILGLLAACSLILNRLRNDSVGLDKTKIFGLSFLVLSLLFWFFNAPTPRFGLGVFLCLPLFIAFVLLGDAPVNQKFLQGCSRLAKVLILALGIVLGGWDAKTFRGEAWTAFDPLGVESPDVVRDSVFGVRPDGTDQCWLVSRCSPFPRTAPITRLGYLFFSPARKLE